MIKPLKFAADLVASFAVLVVGLWFAVMLGVIADKADSVAVLAVSVVVLVCSALPLFRTLTTANK